MFLISNYDASGRLMPRLQKLPSRDCRQRTDTIARPQLSLEGAVFQRLHSSQ